ncbi:DNA-directed RNA polymerase subunit H [archaeon]|nr:DNA-directed RNA polymerase subunit H [archaeon]
MVAGSNPVRPIPNHNLKKMEKKFNISQHILVPEHIKLNDEEKTVVLKQYNIEETKLPKIFLKDPAIQHLEANVGDVIKIIRKSPTNVKSIYYRVVING